MEAGVAAWLLEKPNRRLRTATQRRTSRNGQMKNSSFDGSPLAVSTTMLVVPTVLRLSDELEGAAYFTIAEALANTLKHSRADRLDVELRENDDRLIVRVSDNGDGFNAAAARGTGLTNLRDRVAAVGGALQIDSSPHAGTTVMAEFPLPSERRRR
jgi:signal transduction histidine kinase